jgi:hypothetical protein
LNLTQVFDACVDNVDKILKILSFHPGNNIVNSVNPEGFLHFPASFKLLKNFFSRIDVRVYANKGFRHSNRPNINNVSWGIFVYPYEKLLQTHVVDKARKNKTITSAKQQQYEY